jgi:phosphohistidine phosphatase SixA
MLESSPMRRSSLAVAIVAVLAVSAAVRAQDDLFAGLRTPGHFGLMRHSTAPGSDDPPNFTLGECGTQRNLSAGGRAQAQAIGARLRAAGLTNVRLVSSQWCRTLDTARLLGVGAVEELPTLNSLVSYPGQSASMTADARRWIQQQDLSRPTILVTHQVNIGAIVNAYPNEGEIVVVQRTPTGELRVLGTILPDR